METGILETTAAAWYNGQNHFGRSSFGEFMQHHLPPPLGEVARRKPGRRGRQDPLSHAYGVPALPKGEPRNGVKIDTLLQNTCLQDMMINFTKWIAFGAILLYNDSAFLCKNIDTFPERNFL
jgi:hypothetical protein